MGRLKPRPIVKQHQQTQNHLWEAWLQLEPCKLSLARLRFPRLLLPLLQHLLPTPGTTPSTTPKTTTSPTPTLGTIAPKTTASSTLTPPPTAPTQSTSPNESIAPSTPSQSPSQGSSETPVTPSTSVPPTPSHIKPAVLCKSINSIDNY